MKTRNKNKPVLIPCHSVGRLSGLFCWPQWQNLNNCSVQPHSKFSKLVSSLSPQRTQRLNRISAQPGSNISKCRMSPMSPVGQKPVRKNLSAQPHSKFSKLGISCSTRPSRTVDLRTCPRRASATTSKAIFKNCSAQLDNATPFLRNVSSRTRKGCF